MGRRTSSFRLALCTGLLAGTLLFAGAAVAQGPVSGELWIPIYDTDEIVLVDAETLAVLERLPMPGGPYAAGLGKSAAGEDRILVSLENTDEIVAIDAATRTVVYRLSVPTTALLVPSPDGSKVYAVYYHASPVLAEIDVERGTVTELPVPRRGGSSRRALRITPDGSTAYLVQGSDGLSIVDLDTGTLIADRVRVDYPRQDDFAEIAGPPMDQYVYDLQFLPGDATRALAMIGDESGNFDFTGLQPVILSLSPVGQELTIETYGFPEDSYLNNLFNAYGGGNVFLGRTSWGSSDRLQYVGDGTAKFVGFSVDDLAGCPTLGYCDLLITIDISSPGSIALPGLSASGPPSWDFEAPGLPDPDNDRPDGCAATLPYRIAGQMAYAVDCDNTNTESVVELWDFTTLTPTIAHSSAPLASGVVIWPYLHLREVAATQQQAEELLRAVEALEEDLAGLRAVRARGSGKGSIQSLIAKVEGALADIRADRRNPAIGKLRAFIDETEAMIRSRRLTESQGRPLVVLAEDIIEDLRRD